MSCCDKLNAGCINLLFQFFNFNFFSEFEILSLFSMNYLVSIGKDFEIE